MVPVTAISTAVIDGYNGGHGSPRSSCGNMGFVLMELSDKIRWIGSLHRENDSRWPVAQLTLGQLLLPSGPIVAADIWPAIVTTKDRLPQPSNASYRSQHCRLSQPALSWLLFSCYFSFGLFLLWPIGVCKNSAQQYVSTRNITLYECISG